MAGTLRVDTGALEAGAGQVGQLAASVQGQAQGCGPMLLGSACGVLAGSATGSALQTLAGPLSDLCADLVEALLGLSRGMTRAGHDYARVEAAASAAAARLARQHGSAPSPVRVGGGRPV